MRLALVVGLTGSSLAACASPAFGSVQIGQLAPGATSTCVATQDHAQRSVTSGNGYAVPSTGGIANWILTSWSTNAGANLSQTLTMKVFRQVTGLTYTAVGHDGPQPLVASSLNSFPASLPVKSGDLLGFHVSAAGGDPACRFATSLVGDLRLFSIPPGDLADGSSGSFIETTGERLNISAELEPANTFSLAGVTLNKKKGTATLSVTVPNPGELTASGNGVSAASGGAAISTAVTGPGAAQLTIKAKGKKKRKLKRSGKVRLSFSVSFTPTGGDPSVLPAAVKLKKKL